VLALALLLQIQAADSVYATPALRDFVAKASLGNRAPAPSLAGYRATVETELALVLRDSVGREMVGQIEQLAAKAEWERSGRYDMHVVGFRSQSLGAPYSALTFTRMYTVPTLYGNRLVIGMNDGIARTRRDTAAARKQIRKDSAAGMDRYRAVHPLAVDRDKYYRFRGGDTVATLYVRDRAVRVVRVFVEPVSQPRSNFTGYVGEMDFDADKRQLVRLRGRLIDVTSRKDPVLIRGMGGVGVAYVEFENAEINGKYWLPSYQRSEFQVQMELFGETRPIYRIISRFHDYDIRTTADTIVTLAEMDTLPRTRAKLTFATRDSVSRYGEWRANLGDANHSVDGDDFDDLAPDVWKATGKTRVSYWPRDLNEAVRYNRVEGLFTGVHTTVRFRDAAPGLTARFHLGYAWTEETARGSAAATLRRGKWMQTARAERTLATTNDFLLAFESGLSNGPIFGVDDHDYVDRWTAGYSATRIFKNVDRALLTSEIAFVADRPERTRVERAWLGDTAFGPVRPAWRGNYGRLLSRLEWHPRVTGETLAPGLGFMLSHELASGSLDWQKIDVRLAARQYWHGIAFATRIDAGTVLSDSMPPQVMYEMGGGYHLPSYDYKEFGGDRAAVGRAGASYQFPVLRTPRRIGWLVLPGLGPGVATGVHGGWAEASTDAARASLALLGSTPTRRVRGTVDYRLTFLSGAMGFGMARPIGEPGRRWKPFFSWGGSF
jgi:hypothetical protein